jgi:hypothetical protein
MQRQGVDSAVAKLQSCGFSNCTKLASKVDSLLLFRHRLVWMRVP